MDAAFYLPSGLGDDEDEENIVLGGQGGGSSWLQGLRGDVLDEANNDVYYTERDPGSDTLTTSNPGIQGLGAMAWAS